ncbi:hypothetical protein JHL17_19875 [Azospirillum sp. YIM B02556]|uniref:Uncharacterized protein n=1 Tax=Azospirillum endophyticum TaxID=2800326 RepID=A0ABS1F8I4_9PROT|nr:hypothetical protein [Azospirillum endophyticum]MBK1839673.1 hypothetical protein [Azospirillum endophyticum]
MANASKKHMSASGQGKGTGAGATTDLPAGSIGDNAVLSNRDKSRHSDARGLDSKAVQTEQMQDHVANHNPDDERPTE